MDQKIVKNKGVCFAGYPDVKMLNLVLNSKKGIKQMKLVKHLLFGDYIKLEFKNGKPVKKTIDGQEYVYGRARGMSGYVPVNNILANRILEVNFIDVGQGDGCHIVTPEDKHFLIDAGASNNMFRFLSWRFNLRRAKARIPPFDVVISHSDLDHYYGFNAIFKASGNSREFAINKIYHNGMIEASGSGVDSLGTIKDKQITGLCLTNAQYKKRVKGLTKKGRFIEMLENSNAPKEALYKGYGSIYKMNGMNLEVLAPVHDKAGGVAALPVLGNKGVTKNGHSVVLKLHYGKLRIILGGDLNSVSEDYLIEKYSGVAFGKLRKERLQKNLSATRAREIDSKINTAISKARNVFECDIAKSCHHGSPDFTHEFLKVLNPIVTVISSGDDEPHCHPRPDTLGTIGKHSRGERSLIFSTELARSGLEFLDIGKILAERQKAGLVSTKIKERVVTRYGMINVRSDGERVVIAQMLERNSPRGNWDIHTLVWNNDKNEFEYLDYLKRIK